ncbi:hypothetical protein OUZ56_009838 [Daphnia magna]|uniref:Uncharacterized protein n=1 Tax=Daphnia magna TaxID=35525 RepID=A0ABR0AH45_9CRUS|nr:hypothetical protein OUZ56_009838 [Daphnia magna]
MEIFGDSGKMMKVRGGRVAVGGNRPIQPIDYIGISEEARHQLDAECERPKIKVHQQQSVIDEEIRVLRLRLKTLSDKLTPSGKDNSVCEFFEGECMQDIGPTFMCFEKNCGKVFKHVLIREDTPYIVIPGS